VVFESKKELELELEKIPHYPKPKRVLEQYETPASIASHMLWEAYMRGDVAGKSVLEPGCGTAKFTIGALLLGSKLAVCIDVDEDVVSFANRVLEEKYPLLRPRVLLVVGDFRDLEVSSVDTVFMNPPFGVYRKNRGLDLQFLRKALSTARSVYTIHKFTEFLDKLVYELADSYGFRVLRREYFNFPIPMMFETHRRKVYRVKTVFYVLKRVE